MKYVVSNVARFILNIELKNEVKAEEYMTEVILKRKKANISKLLSFGFEKRENDYIYQCNIVDGYMSMTVVVSQDGKIFSEVIDKSTDEEYVLHRVPEATGTFVGLVKTDYNAVLENIFENCFESEIFKGEQAKSVIAYITNKYDDELEYLWQKFPDNAVVRRKDNKKWYAALLTVSRRRLGIDSNERVEIIDLRMTPENIEKMVDGIKILPGYHMNKKHWITICLDGSASLDEIFQRIDDSYSLAVK